MGRCSTWSRRRASELLLDLGPAVSEDVLGDALPVLVAEVDRACPATVLVLVDGGLARSVAGHGGVPRLAGGVASRLRRSRCEKRKRSRSLQKATRRGSSARMGSPHSRQRTAPGAPSVTRR